MPTPWLPRTTILASKLFDMAILEIREAAGEIFARQIVVRRPVNKTEPRSPFVSIHVDAVTNAVLWAVAAKVYGQGGRRTSGMARVFCRLS